MAKLRKLAILLDKPQLVKPSNEAYQISRRSYVPTHNKAIHQVDFSKCTDSMIRLSLEAQSLFSLRREESMKLIISEAWIGDSLRIKPSWTKGGIGRTPHITNHEQRQWLIKASQQVPSGQSLISKNRTYKQHLSHYQTQTKQMGLRKCHGLRHAYAQRRYHELTKEFDPHKKGWPCPIANGTASKALNVLQKSINRKVHEIISRKIEHSQRSIIKIYVG